MKGKLAILFAATVLVALTLAQDEGGPPSRSAPPPNPALMPNLNSKGTPAGHTLDNITITDGPRVGSQDTTATITWITNKNAATYVRFGTDPNTLDRQYWQAGGGTVHTAPLSDLQPGTRYYFAIINYGNTVGTNGEFQTTGGREAARSAPPEKSSTAQTAGTPATTSTPSDTTAAAAQQPATTPPTPEQSAPAEQTAAANPAGFQEGKGLPQTASPLPLLGLVALGSLAFGVITMKK